MLHVFMPSLGTCVTDVSRGSCSTCNFLTFIFSPYLWSWSMSYHESVGRLQSKECYFIYVYIYTFVAFFCLFIKKFVFLSFSFLFLMNHQISGIYDKKLSGNVWWLSVTRINSYEIMTERFTLNGNSILSASLFDT